MFPVVTAITTWTNIVRAAPDSTKDKKSTKHTVHEQKETGRSRKALEWRSAPTDKEKGFEIIKSFWKWSQYRTRSAPVPQLQKLWWKMILVDLDFKGHFTTDPSSENPPPFVSAPPRVRPHTRPSGSVLVLQERVTSLCLLLWDAAGFLPHQNQWFWSGAAGRLLCVHRHFQRKTLKQTHGYFYRSSQLIMTSWCLTCRSGFNPWVLMFTCSRLLLCWSRICRRGRSGCWSREASGRGSACVWPGNENE